MTTQTSLVERARELLLTDTQGFYALVSEERRRLDGGDPPSGWPTKVDLSGIDLSGLCLANSSFMYDLGLSDLCFEGANLSKTTFTRCGLERSRFSGAVLEGTRFVDCGLHATDFCNSALNRGVIFHECNLSWIDLEGADIEGLHAASCCLRSAKMAGANMQHVTLRECTMDEADFTGADLRWADFSTSSLYGAKGIPRSFYRRHRRVVERSLGFTSK